MGHQDESIVRRYYLFLTIVALILAEGQSTDFAQTTNDAQKGRQEYIRARRIVPRVLSKRSVPVNSTLRLTEKGNHLDEISIELVLDSKKIWLDLRLNWDLVSDGYFEQHQKNGTDVIHRPSSLTADLCHYQGKIRGEQTSWAAVSTCDGISGVVFDGEHLHHLEPIWSPNNNYLNSTSTPKNDLVPWETLHYKQSDLLSSNHSCDHDKTPGTNQLRLERDGQQLGSFEDGFHGSEKIAAVKSSSKRIKRGAEADSYHEPFDSNHKSRYVEMVIVVDNRKFKELSSDLKRTISRTKEISNIVNAVYAPLNIYICLVGIVVWTEKDEITLSPNGDDTLANFLYYRRERLIKEHPNDNAQLLTAVEFEKGVVGKAMQGPMCSYKFSGGVNSDHNAMTGVVATTIAHELGHNFGLPHDGEECKCTGANGRCIMAASSSSNRTSTWSSCSLEHLAFAFDHGMDYCLRNKPKKLFDGPVCGNGFTEEGEECDCGIVDSESCRKNTCCDAANCKLHKNATCGAGNCCDLSTCHYKSGGHVCRTSSNTCDLPEFCSGESEFCPEDVHKLNGLLCKSPNGEAYCYEGKCRTHTDQCRLLWGPSGNNSDYMCYQKNTNGSRYGNCGYDLVTGNYKACKADDTRCGVLHCKYYHEKLEFGYEPVATLSSFFVSTQGNIHPCRSVTVDFGTRDVDPGLVPDGAKCGTDKMCVNQECVPVESISAPFMCEGGCGSYGVCNSKGHCHCDAGYGGTACSDSGFGGSVDSGPAIDPYATSLFAKSLYVTFCGFIPLIAIISFYIYYANENFKQLCVRGRAFARPQSRNNNKSQGGGGVGLRSLDISGPNSNSNANTSNNNSKATSPDDFFGKYKGFTISPLSQTPEDPRSPITSASASEVIKNFNNNSGTVPTSVRTVSNGSIPSATNSNVYYSPVPTQTVNETLVKNHNNEKPSKSYTNSFLQKGMARVSWAQPIAQPLPTNSPGSEDENGSSASAADDIPSQNNILPYIAPPPPRPSQISNNQISNGSSQASNTSTTSVSSSRFGSKEQIHPGASNSRGVSSVGHSAFSRLAGAIPFVRNSIRNLTSSFDDSKSSGSPSGRKHLEISTPILHTGNDGSSTRNNYQNLMGVSSDSDQNKFEDEIDYENAGSTKKTSKGRYANVPLIDESPVKTVNTDKQWPKNTALERIKPAESKQTERKPVLRAHSMIQPSRNSIHSSSSNTNYNSLRRSRPSAPPPKPPSVPPPPPPTNAHPLPALPVKARSESPPPITKPKNILRPPVNTSNISSILKFSLGKSNARPEHSPLDIPRVAKAPIARLDPDSSPTAAQPASTANNAAVDNIYDEISESKDLNLKAEEKVETLSTGSAESAGGLLSEIISEIQNRNKDSIYNSVDRRKKKREALESKRNMFESNKSSTGAPPKSKSPSCSPGASPKLKPKPAVPPQPAVKSSLVNERINSFKVSPPRITSQSPSIVSSIGSQKRSSSPGRSSPLLSTGTPPSYKPVVPTAPMIPTLNPRLGSLANPTSSAPIKPPHAAAAAAASAPTPIPTTIAKPTCAVNGVPKVTSSPSYVAKINYFSNLGAGKSEDKPMKPINSLSTTLADGKNAVASTIYAPSSVVTPEPTHLSTIRPTYARPYMNNKLPEEPEDNSVGAPAAAPSQPVRTAGIYAPNSNSEYGTLGRSKGKKVIEENKAIEASPPKPPPQAQGYKPFNPYLNRPLTFSTFRPNSSPSAADKPNTGSAVVGGVTSSSS